MKPTQPPGNRRAARLAGRMETTGQKPAKAMAVLLDGLETNIATTPFETVYTEDRVQLKHYHPIGARKVRRPLLIVYALINRETMLDLQPDRSVVRKLLESGVDVYMVDWGYPTRKDRYLTIDDHVNGYIDNIVDFIRREHRIDAINLMGICMGGTFGVIYTALHPRKVKNLITTVTPTSFDTDQGLLHLWMKMIDTDAMVDAFGNIPGDLLNFGFLMLNPARLVVDKYFGFMKNIDDKRFVENFIRMEKWIFDSPDVPGETFREFIRDCYQRNLLIRNRMMVGGKRVDLARIRVPLLNFYGRYDHLVPPAACDKLCGAVGSEDTTDVCLDTGHIGIYVSSKCQAAFTPRIVRWLEARDGVDEAPRVTVIRSKAVRRTVAKNDRRKHDRPPSAGATGTTGR